MCNTTPAICPEFIQKRIGNVLFVNYPNRVWNRYQATFLTEYRLVSVEKHLYCVQNVAFLNISKYCLKSIKIVSGLDYHIFSLHLALHYYTLILPEYRPVGVIKIGQLDNGIQAESRVL